MPYTPTNPEDCFAISPFGFGPFPADDAVVVCPSHPSGSGYGGVGYGYIDEGGTGYSLSSFGSYWFPAPSFPIHGGYGGDPYGLAGYGSTEDSPPSISSATSLSGYTIEVFFSEGMDPNDPLLFNPTSYTALAIVGAQPTLTSVTIGSQGGISPPLDNVTEVNSVILHHTGTTLGGTVQISAQGIRDVAGNPILNTSVSCYSLGEIPTYTVNPLAGDYLELTFSEDMLLGVNYPASAVDTILSPESYDFTTTYPVDLTAYDVEHPVGGDATLVGLSVTGQTSVTYTANVCPAAALSYDSSALPSASPFTATLHESGVTLTSSLVGGQLSLSQTGTGTGAWHFPDLSSKVVDGASVRYDLTFDATGSFSKNPLAVAADIVIGWVDDGTVAFGCSMGWDGPAALPILTFWSGTGGSGFTQQSNDYDWSSGQHTITLIRNMKAGFATFLFDGAVVYTTNITNLAATPYYGSGFSFGFNTTVAVPTVTAFKVASLIVTGSSTVFSGSWNFLHEQTATFVGNPQYARNTMNTRRGPLVKGWGDATPATNQNVVVSVNGVDVDVASVNPYVGEITTDIPIPLVNDPALAAQVAVDYQWMASPIMGLAGLNTEGLVLNKYDMTRGHHDPAAHGEQNQVLPGTSYLADPGYPKGAALSARFPMGVVLGPILRPTPLYISHRYLGFERAYSALLNTPTTMLLNQHPNRSTLPGFSRSLTGESISYNGLVRPTSGTPAWVKVGTDTGGINVGLGTYTLKDEKSGSFDPDDPQATFYYRDVDLTFPSSIYLNTRFFVDSENVVSDGVFTGVGFGAHDAKRLYLAGCLLVNNVQHVGFLTNAEKPALLTSWLIGPQAMLSLEGANEAKTLASQVPSDLTAGDRFQILTGPQAGVYTLSTVVFQTDGYVTLTVTSDFPAHWDTYGNKYPTAFFEVLWGSQLSTFSMEIDPEQETATLQVSGLTNSHIATLDGDAASIPHPAETSLLLPSTDQVGFGQVFWGSLSREATNESTWSFSRYGVISNVTTLAGHEITAASEMSVLPEEDSANEWSLDGDFGFGQVSGGELLLKKTSHHASRELARSYTRTEPFFVPDSKFEVSAKLRVESGCGVNDGSIVINDTIRQIQLGNLTYEDGFSGHYYRRLVVTPTVSCNGLQVPTEQLGWYAMSGSTLSDIDIQEAVMEVAQTAETRGGWWGTLQNAANQNFTDEKGRILEARFAVTGYTTNANGDTGVLVSCSFGSGIAGITLRAGVTPGVRILTDGSVVQEYDFDWTDGELHTYRLIADQVGGVVQVYLDDTLQTPTLNTALFNGDISSNTCDFGQYGYDISGVLDTSLTTTIQWRSVSFQALPSSTTVRTLGVLTGSDPFDIDAWEIPRTDSSTALNSAQVGPVIEEMDWHDWMEVRIWRDPTWGVTVYRPDLPLPSFYQAETSGVPGSGLATETTEPSAGWINVEYRHLPREDATFGYASWGAREKSSVNQQRWDWVRYKLSATPTEDISQPQGMVLNRSNVVNSGELTEDTTLETVVVETLDETRLTLRPFHIYADRVYKVIDGTSVFTSEMWDFDTLSQTLTLTPDSAGNPRAFSGDHAFVTVQFVSGKPITNTYLLNQPLLEGITKLNQNTPPYALGLTGEATRVSVTGVRMSHVDDPVNHDPGFQTADPFQVATFTDDPDTLYEQLEFMEVSNGGQEGIIRFPCEATELSNDTADFQQNEGETIYEVGGTGTPLGGAGDCANLTATSQKVGQATGGHVLDLSGAMLWEGMDVGNELLGNSLEIPHQIEQGGGMPGFFLYASGGNYHGPVLAGGQIGALGGTLAPSTALLYPVSPSSGQIPGRKNGQIYRRTDWVVNLRSVLTDASVPTEQALDEDFYTNLFSLADNVPPSDVYTADPNPDGAGSPTNNGAVFIVLGAGPGQIIYSN